MIGTVTLIQVHSVFKLGFCTLQDIVVYGFLFFLNSDYEVFFPGN